MSRSVEDRRHGLHLPGLPELTGFANHRHRDPSPFRPHRHLDGLEIVWVRDGHLRWWMGDEVFAVTGGTCTVTAPREAHGAEDDRIARCGLSWCTIDVPSRPQAGWLGLPEAEGEDLRRSLLGIRRHHFPVGERIPDGFRRLAERVSCGAASAAGRLALRVAVVELLLAVVEAADGGESGPSAAISRVVEYVQRHCDRAHGVAEMAATAGLSESHFKSRFKQEMGESPAAFQRRLRLEAALAAIRRGTPVTTAALDHGFASPQHFATAVRRATGRSPRDYRAS